MGLPCFVKQIHSPTPSSPKPRRGASEGSQGSDGGGGEVDGISQHRFLQNKKLVEPGSDYRFWHVRTRLKMSGGAGRGSGQESFFPMEPSHVRVRPMPYTILHLRTDSQTRWSEPLPKMWQDLELRLSSSKEFNDDAGTRYGGYLRGDIEDTLSRDVVETVLAKHDPKIHSPLEITHSSISPQGHAINFEYVFENTAGEWALADVVVVIRGVVPQTNGAQGPKETHKCCDDPAAL